MILNIENLKTMGAFTGAPVEREITWKKGDEEFKATVFVRPMSYKTAVSDLVAIKNNGDAVAARIAYCIVDQDGRPVFSVGDVTGDADPDRGPLDGTLALALMHVIGEVSGLGKTST